MAARPFLGFALRGVSDLRGKLSALRKEEDRAITREVRRGLVAIESRAKRNCPVKTGNLRKRTTHEVAPSGHDGRVGTNVHYAPHVHFGTRRMRGRPYLFDAFTVEHPIFVRRLARALNEAHRKVAKG